MTRRAAGGMATLMLLAALGCGRNRAETAKMESDAYTYERERMIHHDLMGRGIRDPAVLSAMRHVPRQAFVPASLADSAYEDSPLPIGENQTISQPYIVAAMTESLGVNRESTVLEVGTGSGYQAAVLAEIVRTVYSIEILERLARDAGQRLSELGYTNVFVRAGDGYAGWPEHAPFDGIVVTCGADRLPPPLLDQLKPGGRMVIPVGPAGDVQSLQVVTKRSDGTLDVRDVMPVRFVPLTGAHGARW